MQVDVVGCLTSEWLIGRILYLVNDGDNRLQGFSNSGHSGVSHETDSATCHVVRLGMANVI